MNRTLKKNKEKQLTPNEQAALIEFERRVTYLMNEKEAFLEGWKAAIKYFEEKQKRSELSSHFRD